MKYSAKWIRQLIIGIVVGISLLVGASAPAFAQHHDRHNRNRDNRNYGITRRSGIFGTIFGGNRNRRYDQYDRRRYGSYDYYRSRDRHNRSRHHDRHHNRRSNRW